MSAIDNAVYPGHVIGAIAATSGVSVLEAAVGVASVIGGIGGPGAGVIGPAGEFIHAGLNLVVTGRDDPAWRRAQELLLEPAGACQNKLRKMSQDTSPARLDHLQFSPLIDSTYDIVARSKAGIFEQGYASTNYIGEKRHIAVLRTPTFLLRSPDLDAFSKAAAEVMDGSFLAIYPDGELLSEVIANSKDWSQLATDLANAIVGSDQYLGAHRCSGPGRMAASKAHLIVTASATQFRDALGRGDAGLDRILRHSIFIDPSQLPRIPITTSEGARYGYQKWSERIKEVLDHRCAGRGFKVYLTQPMQAMMDSFIGELRSWHENLPARLQPFFSDLFTLPYRLYWAVATTVIQQEGIDWVVPFTLQTAAQLIKHQRRLLEDVFRDAEAAAHQQARIVMLRKLVHGPCVIRDLMRKYSVQRRDVHEPVLKALVSEGAVLLRSGGFLELSDHGRKELLAA